MATVRGRVVISCVLLALAVGGCGGSSGSSSSTGQELASSPGIALRGWYSAVEEGNARTACGLLTDRGRRVIRVESGKPCATLSSSPRRGSKPEIGPVGVRRDLALAITGTKISGLGNVVVLRRIRGRWLVDLPWTPVLDSLHVRGIPPIQRESLPSGGAQMPRILGAAGRYVDKQASSAGAAVHV